MPTSPDQPVFVVPQENLVPSSDHLSKMTDIPASRMFLIKKSLDQYQQKAPDSPIYDASQGDGGASLPGTPPEILERAAQMQIDHGTGYDSPFGTVAFREVVAEKYWQFSPGLGVGPANIIATVGGRDALVKAYEAMLSLGHGRQGDALLVSRVPWLSYNWGPYGVGANVILAPGREEEAWTYSEEGIRASVDFAAKSGRKIAGMVVTNPDNPTGQTITPEKQIALGKAALKAGIAFVLYDWIYHQVTDEEPMDINAFLREFTPAERDRLIFLDGLTKSLGASNIRSAHLIVPEAVSKFIVARASHNVIPSFYGLAVAMAAYEMGYKEASRSIVEPTNASRKVLQTFLEKENFKYIIGKGYYAFIHVGDWIKAKGWEDSEALGQYLAEEHGVATVPGGFFSAYGKDWVRFSYATPPERTQGAAERLLEGLKALE
ncbi:MAG: pyridoxal phosphate-dependent aminotransferase [Anaerolineales bacterium]|uniref:Pyridoxal phosphate-dependent aminotransferase n=1 Tax=Candidatus Desulfolinea nitratireducens TaxID=2841698 RepID=A0A8J6THI8_9CHLR|nr:pyridoxal phosphate-dependent aminotransferase [Candidatus Desulfolinea nitratireducens]MBL6961185.1 pyridoxal phosphate-dependent aminotransferase [Anaerolineales bacterium]